MTAVQTTTMTRTNNWFQPKQSSDAVKSWKGRTAVLAVLAIGIICALMFYLPVPQEIMAVFALGMMFSLMIIGVPVGLSMAISGFLGIYFMAGTNPAISALASVPFTTASSSTYIIIPLFVFMGMMLWQSGVTSKLYHAARVLLHRVPGGLALTTNVAGAGLGSVSGSTIGITYALSRMSIPEMIRAGYDRRLALGSVLSSGTIAQLIPPSVMLVIYAGFAEVPVGPQLMAGVLPGILLTVAYCLSIVIVALVRPKWVGKKSRAERSATVSEDIAADIPTSTSAKLAQVAGAWPIVALVAIILGGIGLGLLTTIEAGGVGALFSLVYCFFAQGAGRFASSTMTAIKGTLAASGSVFLLIIGASIFSRLLAITGATQWLSSQLAVVAASPVLLIVCLIGLYLIIGMFMEAITIILLTVPLILPVVVAAGYDPLWFGVFVVLMAEISLLTPPVGMLVFIGHRLMQDPAIGLLNGKKFGLGDAFVGSMLFVPLALAVVVLLCIFPDLVTWIPSLLSTE